MVRRINEETNDSNRNYIQQRLDSVFENIGFWSQFDIIKDAVSIVDNSANNYDAYNSFYRLNMLVKNLEKDIDKANRKFK